MKLDLLAKRPGGQPVAPHAGAWIETARCSRLPPEVKVAPHAGAWIETAGTTKNSQLNYVAPHAGAWIETGREASGCSSSQLSHPTRVRGLKLATSRR